MINRAILGSLETCELESLGTLINLTINLVQRNILIHSVYTVIYFFEINILTLTREGYLAIIWYS